MKIHGKFTDAIALAIIVVMTACILGFAATAGAELNMRRQGETDEAYIARLEGKVRELRKDNDAFRQRLAKVDKGVATSQPASMPAELKYKGRPITDAQFERHYATYGGNYIVVDGAVTNIGRQRAIIEGRPASEPPPSLGMVTNGSVQWTGQEATILKVLDNGAILVKCPQHRRTIKITGIETSLLVEGQAIPNTPIVYGGNSEGDQPTSSYQTFSVPRQATREEFAAVIANPNAVLARYRIQRVNPDPSDPTWRKNAISYDGGKTWYKVIETRLA